MGPIIGSSDWVKDLVLVKEDDFGLGMLKYAV